MRKIHVAAQRSDVDFHVIILLTNSHGVVKQFRIDEQIFLPMPLFNQRQTVVGAVNTTKFAASLMVYLHNIGGKIKAAGHKAAADGININRDMILFKGRYFFRVEPA